jgi:phosphoesterase RecJ-like protein
MDPAEALIAQAKKIYLASHSSPDGDSLGAMLGLAWALEGLGKEVTCACADPVSAVFAWLPGSDRLVARPPRDEELIVTLDTTDLPRLGSIYKEANFAGKPVLNIDHHVTNERFGTVNLVDPSAAASAELVYDLTQGLGIALDPRAATCLLAGIVIDTQGFRTSNTTPRILRVATALTEAGASLADVMANAFYRIPLSTLRLWGHATNTMQMRGPILWVEISQALLKQIGASLDEAGGLINFLASTGDASIVAVFKERRDGRIEVSLRSTGDFDLTPIAVRFGGGGHSKAAGCIVTGKLAEVREKILDALAKEVLVTHA